MISLPIDLQPYLVIALIGAAFVLIYLNIIKPIIGFTLLALCFLVFDILTTQEVMAGFSNESIASIALLILITAGIRNNFHIEQLIDRIFKDVVSYRKFLWIMMTKVSALSSFVNNTPVVALMTPYVFNWGKKHNISPSKLLIPLSFATICGGMITVIGTSTNLVLNGFLSANTLPTLLSSELLLIGLCVTVGCILFITLFGNYILPDHRDIIDVFAENKREYLVEKRLPKTSKLVGKTVYEAGLRNLTGVYLVEIVRADKSISPVSPIEELAANDTLIFAGKTDDIIDFSLKETGIELPSATQVSSSSDEISVIEAVIGANSSIVGKSVKSADFRNRYDAAVIAIHRNGERLGGKIGDIKLQSGDVLLLFSGDDFYNRVDLYKDIILVSSTPKPKNGKKRNVWLFLAVVAVSIGLIPLGVSTLFMSLLLITAYMVITNLITIKTVKRDLDINMMLILVLSLGIGQAITNTNAGTMVANAIINIFQPYGIVATLLGIMIITVILTTFVTNVGAVAIMFPIAMSISSQFELAQSPFYIAIAYAASAAFLSPIGYQTNLIIFGPGGYSFKDFIRVGLPVTLIYLAIAFGGICLLYQEVLF